MLRRPLTSAARPVLAVFAAAALAISLAACTPGSDDPSPKPEPSGSASPSGTPTPEGPTFQPDGTAEDNLPIFTAVTQQVWASEQRAAGRAYIDALVAVGFDKAKMQVTQDESTVGRPAESLQFSVSWGADKCLVGQVGPSTGEPVTAVLDQLAEGRCLVGTTRTIDW